MVVDQKVRPQSGPSSRWVRLSCGLSLHITQWQEDSSPVLLIVHGGGHDATCWATVAGHLEGVRVVVPDARGHGRSDWDPDGDYSCRRQVADILEVLDELGIERCVVAGHSMGGLNALELAGSHPHRVAALVLVDVGTETRKTGLDHVRRKRARDDSPDLGQRYGIRPAPSDPRLGVHVPTYCGDADYRRSLLVAAKVPLLVVRGAHSAILTPESAAATARLVGGRVVDVPESGHNVSLSNPLATADALRTFLDEVATADVT